MPTPADDLRAAAEKLRALAATAAKLSPTPWVVTDEDVLRCSNKERGIVADRSCEPDEAGDLPYLAAMHPGVGTALADWLDSWTGIEFDESAAMPDDLRHALAVARQILGSTP